MRAITIICELDSPIVSDNNLGPGFRVHFEQPIRRKRWLRFKPNVPTNPDYQFRPVSQHERNLYSIRHVYFVLYVHYVIRYVNFYGLS